MKAEIFGKLNELATEIGANFFGMWGVRGGNSWICIRQDDENDFTVQLRVIEFETFNNAKKQMMELFEAVDCKLESATDEPGFSLGYCKNFTFVSKDKFDAAIKEKERALMAQRSTTIIRTQINGDINNNGGILQTGEKSRITKNEATPSEKRWFSKQLVIGAIAVVGGIIVIIVAEYFLRQLGWTQ